MVKAKPRAGELTTTNYHWTLPTVGASDDQWGGYLNANLISIDSVVFGIQASIPTVPAASTTTPAMDGTAAVGTGATWARADHVHPTDISLYPASNPSSFQTAAQVTAALPIASSTTPVMDGTAAVGTGTTWARADHKHPSDTSKYDASNPSSFQTAAQVTTSLGAYLPKAGGTLTGALFGTAFTASGAIGGASISSTANISASGTLNANGSVNSGNLVTAVGGYQTQAGQSGAVVAHMFNINWTGTAQLWIDTSNVGTITVSSDYRIKKDVAALPTMWERAKALRPISYTHKDYTPANAPAKEDGSPADPLFIADDIERWGFVAHELQETLIPSAATGVKDDPVHVQSPNPWVVIATLTKALQEAMARIEALEAAR